MIRDKPKRFADRSYSINRPRRGRSRKSERQYLENKFVGQLQNVTWRVERPLGMPSLHGRSSLVVRFGARRSSGTNSSLLYVESSDARKKVIFARDSQFGVEEGTLRLLLEHVHEFLYHVFNNFCSGVALGPPGLF